MYDSGMKKNTKYRTYQTCKISSSTSRWLMRLLRNDGSRPCLPKQPPKSFRASDSHSCECQTSWRLCHTWPASIHPPSSQPARIIRGSRPRKAKSSKSERLNVFMDFLLRTKWMVIETPVSWWWSHLGIQICASITQNKHLKSISQYSPYAAIILLLLCTAPRLETFPSFFTKTHIDKKTYKHSPADRYWPSWCSRT